MTDLDHGEFLKELPEIPEEEFVIFGTVHAKPEHADALEAVYAETTRLAEFEPGTVYYCLARDSDKPNIFHFYERYTGKEAFDAHNAQPIIQKLIKDQWFIGVKAKFMKAIGPASV
ncbi:uncharacterized protein N7443_003957 [Penicillium atrosanguineum]|uniref:uncharacterized protein n=1 Tax=Penicillium atrosanguineum TaxID=1132637 RepID=UPI002390AEF0|nr:uncharacterized protein N7443_003957 [Penicillium atrosanguineum]KAJ5304297.1 hypothetical protein N7443_003957 [Penicillium atrosanguineum]